MKQCRTCNITKDLDSFHLSNWMADGKCADCKECKSLKYKGQNNRFKHEDAVQPYLERIRLIDSLWRIA